FFFFSSRRRHTRWPRDWSSDVCSSDLVRPGAFAGCEPERHLARRLQSGAAGEQVQQAARALFSRAIETRAGLGGIESFAGDRARSEERRVGKECGGGCRRWLEK